MFQKIYQKLQTREGITLVASLALSIGTLMLIVGGFDHHRVRSSGDDRQQSVLTVTGKGEVVAIPDTAQFTFTLSSDEKTMAESQKQVALVGNELIKKLKASGIKDTDIATEGFTAYPKYENKEIAMSPCSRDYCPPYNPGNPVITGYTVTHTYSVKVRDLEKASLIATLLTDAGVSNINGPDFTHADSEALKNEARDKAIDDAQDQAKILASQLGVRLGDIVDFQVIENGNYPMPLYTRTASMDAGMEKTIMPTIEPGENTIRMQVQITYRMRD